MKRLRWALLCLLSGVALIAGACSSPAPGGTGNQLPIAQITATPDAGEAPLEVALSSAGSHDPDGTIASYSWDFGDGSALSTAQNPDHTFTADGAYVVKLTVTDNSNAIGISPEGDPRRVGRQRVAGSGDQRDSGERQGAPRRDPRRVGLERSRRHDRVVRVELR